MAKVTKKTATSPKKAAAPKRAAAKAKKAPAADDVAAAKRKELAAVAKGMVLEDLAFLVAQAKVLLHNRQTEELEDELAAEFERPGSIAAARSPMKGVSITRTPSGNANLSLAGNFKLLTPEEVGPLARIALDGTSEADRMDRMYRWLDRERRDILNDAGISGPRSSNLLAILRCFESSFSPKKKGKA